MSKKTEEQILIDYVDSIDNPLDNSNDKETELEVIKQLAAIPEIDEYFRVMMGEDIKRYWKAADENQRTLVRGAFARIAYLRGSIKKLRETEEIKDKVKKR